MHMLAFPGSGGDQANVNAMEQTCVNVIHETFT